MRRSSSATVGRRLGERSEKVAEGRVAPGYVLDASALLALLHEELGGEKVEPLVGRSVVSAVNLSETLQKGLSRGADVAGLREDLEALGLEVVSFTAEDAELAAELWAATRRLGLSFGDRSCLATAKRFRVPAVTADRDWTKIEDEDLRVECVR